MAIDFPASPTTGQTLQSGNQVWTYDGTVWKSSYQSSGYVQQLFTATAGQTSFTVTGGYAPNLINVFQNGVKLVAGTDVTITSGTSVVLAVGATVGDIIEVVGWAQIASGLSPADIGSTVQAWDTNLDQISGLTPTNGNVITGNGTAWVSSAPSYSGRLIRGPRFLTSGSSYTTPAGCNNIMIEIIGAGGGGGGINGSGSIFTSGGGGNGIFATKYVAVSPSTAYTYAIGAGGTGGSGTTPTNGAAGGTTSITIGGVTYSVSGGGGGGLANGNNGAQGTSGTATNMDHSTPGIAGSGGNGGSCITPFSIGYGATVVTAAPTNPGTQYGAGGGGATISSSLSNVNGGNGFQGCIRIWEFT